MHLGDGGAGFEPARPRRQVYPPAIGLAVGPCDTFEDEQTGPTTHRRDGVEPPPGGWGVGSHPWIITP